MGVLTVCFAWALIIPISLTAPPPTPLTSIYFGGLALFGGALMLVLWTAVSTRSDRATARWRAALLLAVTLALWAPTQMWAERGEEPWAWLAGFAVAACALARLHLGIVMAVVLEAAAVIGGVVNDSAVVAGSLVLLACAAVVWAMCQAFVWLLRLLWAAQAAKEAQTELAIAEERLRVSRELHDVLGQRLGVIALKAELAADLAARDPRRAAAESDGIRQVATETLIEVRRAVQGRTIADLGAQLEAADLVLYSAGIAATIDADPEVLSRVSPTQSHLLASVVREAVTNVLRHSDARHVGITVAEDGRVPTLLIVNDGVRGSGRNETSGGSGLSTLSGQCAAVGAHLTVKRSAGYGFELRVECTPETGGSR